MLTDDTMRTNGAPSVFEMDLVWVYLTFIIFTRVKEFY